MTLPHGKVETPIFMPVGTQGTVKGCLPSELEKMNVQILLGNTYHLLLRPGTERLENLGGLHKFMGWNRPILTDSGGFQVFSLAKLAKIDGDGVSFQSHLDGHEMRLTPESVMLAQSQIGSDIGMVLDVCPAGNAEETEIKRAVETTLRWAQMAREAKKKPANVFGIVQGGRFPDLREACAKELVKLDFDGYAIGGVAVGEAQEEILKQTRFCAPLLPAGKPRYAMGIGEPTQLLEMISHGVDMFDCVIPTREARHGIAYTNAGRLNLKNEKFKDDLLPLDTEVISPASTFSRAYIRHLVVSEELLGLILLTYHNIAFFLQLMQKAREAIRCGTFSSWKDEWIRNYLSK
jgi:queuine tRNA-ribosyltransferase